MELPDNEAHVWYFDTNFFSNTTSFERFLSIEEISKADRFKFEKDRKTNILARGILRVLSGKYHKSDANKINFRYEAHGKPQYNFDTEINFNVSHSGSYIVIAFAKGSSVGVDIEKIKSNFEVMNIARNFFSTDEIGALETIDDNERVDAFFRCWTRKESFIKAKGDGLSFPLASFSMSLIDNHPKLLKTEWDSAEKDQWRVFSFHPSGDYVGALVVDKTISQVRYFSHQSFKETITPK